MEIRKTSETAYNPVFLKILEDIPGGVTISTREFPTDLTELKAGTMLCESSSTAGLFNPVKNAKSTSTQTSNVSITVKGPSLFKAGEFIGYYGGKTLSTVSSVTRTAATTDTIVTATAVGALTTAAIIMRAAAASVTTAVKVTHKYSPDSILRDNIACRNADFSTIGNVWAGAVVRGTVNESLLPYSVTAANKTSLTARIRFA